VLLERCLSHPWYKSMILRRLIHALCERECRGSWSGRCPFSVFYINEQYNIKCRKCQKIIQMEMFLKWNAETKCWEQHLSQCWLTIAFNYSKILIKYYVSVKSTCNMQIRCMHKIDVHAENKHVKNNVAPGEPSLVDNRTHGRFWLVQVLLLPE